MPSSLTSLNAQIIKCRRCPRLVEYRETVGKHPPKRHVGEKYWSRPVPGFGDPGARIYVLGLAPAANGGNRTGRIFTGDRSGDWLYDALHANGLSNQPFSVSANDGMQLRGVYIGAAVRCAPPDNKPILSEFENCRPYAEQEIGLLPKIRVYVALGSIAYTTLRKILRSKLDRTFRFPAFGHGVKATLPDGKCLICSYHPSQQNTFTGKLTREMLVSVFRAAREWVG